MEFDAIPRTQTGKARRVIDERPKQTLRKPAMTQAFICDAIRTPIGRYGGALAGVRADDLGAIPLKALMAAQPAGRLGGRRRRDLRLRQPGRRGQPQRRPHVRPAGRPAHRGAGHHRQPPVRLRHGRGRPRRARSIKSGETGLMIAGGVESMSPRPLRDAQGRIRLLAANAAIYDTTIGWRFINPLMKKLYETHSMPQTADNVAADFNISRADQDAFALRSQQRWAAAHAAGRFADELVPVVIPQKKGDPMVVDTDEHPRPETTLEMLAKLKGVNGPELQRDRRQRLGRERRRLRPAAGLRSRRRPVRPQAAGPCGRHGHRRRAAAHHGLRPGPGGAQGAGPDRPDAWTRWTSSS